MIEGYRLDIDLPGLPPLNSAANKGWKWKLGKRKAWGKIIAACVPRAKRPVHPLPHARVTITRCSSQPPDYDNMGNAAKWVLDELQKIGVLDDDRGKCIGRPTLLWKKAPLKRGHTLVLVEQCEAEDLDVRAWLGG